ncbi:hypothetical protein AHF37_12791, partial [Paragonimus kellicotti]
VLVLLLAIVSGVYSLGPYLEHSFFVSLVLPSCYVLWLVGILSGLSRLLGSLNFICTIVRSLCEHTVGRSSIIIWAYLFTSVLLILSLPVLAAAITMLLFDRKFSSAFFDPLGGGDPVLFQHLFWFFGHPE